MLSWAPCPCIQYKDGKFVDFELIFQTLQPAVVGLTACGYTYAFLPAFLWQFCIRLQQSSLPADARWTDFFSYFQLVSSLTSLKINYPQCSLQTCRLCLHELSYTMPSLIVSFRPLPNSHLCSFDKKDLLLKVNIFRRPQQVVNAKYSIRPRKVRDVWTIQAFYASFIVGAWQVAS